MCEILIFGGTAEGRRLAEFCARRGILFCVSVATDYGASLVNGGKVLSGRLTEAEMLDLIKEKRFKLVVDATHPFAIEATRNISSACKKANARLIRVTRERGKDEFGKYFETIEDLAKYLSKTDGNIFITTGGKNLSPFCGIENYRERCAVRVLPDAVSRCLELGFAKEKIIAAKGPFTEEENIEHLKKFGARYLATKDSGGAGGFNEKLGAAKKLKIEALVVKRPDEDGVSVSEAEKIILEAGGENG